MEVEDIKIRRLV